MRKALGSIPIGSICLDLILLLCVFAYTRGICHNTEHQRQTLKRANGLFEKTDLTLVVALTPRRVEHTRQEFAEPYPLTQATAVLRSTRDAKQNSRTLAAVTRGVVRVALLFIRRVG